MVFSVLVLSVSGYISQSSLRKMPDEDKDKWLQITNSVFNRDKSKAISNHSPKEKAEDSDDSKISPATPITNRSSNCHCQCHHHQHDHDRSDFQEKNRPSILEQGLELDTVPREKTGKSFSKGMASGEYVKQTQHLLQTIPEDSHQLERPPKEFLLRKKSTRNTSLDATDEPSSSRLTRRQMEGIESQLKKLTLLLSQKTSLIDKQKIIIQRQERKLDAFIMGQIDSKEREKVNGKELGAVKDFQTETCVPVSDDWKEGKVVGLDVLTYRIAALEKKMENLLEDLPKRIESQLVRLTQSHRMSDGYNNINQERITSGFPVTRSEVKSKWKVPPLIKPRANLISKRQREEEEKEKYKFEEKVEEMEKIVEDLKQFFLLLVFRAESRH